MKHKTTKVPSPLSKSVSSYKIKIIKMTKFNIYIIHGYTASKNSNWFPYLKKKLERNNVVVNILNMPNSQKPRFNEWINHLEKQITDYDENTIFIGHSLGCVTILNYLNKNISKRIKGLYLISGFVEKTPIPELLEFVQPELDYTDIIKLTENRIAISAKDDDIIHYEYSRILAEKLDAKFILLNEGKHFIDRDNFTEFPLLLKEIENIIN